MLAINTTPAAPRPAARGRGFTLVEILGVVMILGIISAILIPQISSRDDQKAASAARVVMADLLYAQNRAITVQKAHYVQFDAAAGTYQVLEGMSPAAVIKNPVNGGTYQVKFGAGSPNGLTQMSLQSATFDGQATLAFDPMGVPYSYNASTGALSALNAGSVVIKSGAYQVTVSVAPFSGELRVQ